ncbi:C-type lectin domain family 4 member A isoform d [Mus musculus]|uniref:C-type lectin domain family 4 member A isoform d n=1 Tax=Mus musculus TaxID=10090 RepID=UPI00211F4244|nr:C-type lectin domain family 4 member A isoform d [Mus musculus]
MVLFISITCLDVFSCFSIRTSTCLVAFSCFSLRTCNSLAVFSCISLSELLKSFLMSSTIIMRYAFKSRSTFSVVFGCPGLGGVQVLRSDDDKVWSCCPKDWRLFGSHCYLVPTVSSSASWNKSEENCSRMGAHLVVIQSQEEQDFITGILDTHAAYFIGLWDTGHRQWQWVDQTPYEESITFWHNGEPSSGNEKCATIIYRWKTGWGWNDISCSLKQKSVCQMKKINL